MPKYKNRYGRWRNGHRCVECEKTLTYHQKMNSHGRCPKCGFKHADAVTVVETTEYAYRYVMTFREYWLLDVRVETNIEYKD